MSWFWTNVPLEAAFLAAWIGIPLWLVVRHPDRGPDAATSQLSLELDALTGHFAEADSAEPLAAVPGSHDLLGESLERVAMVR